MFLNIKHRQYEQRIVAGSIDEVYALRVAKSECWQRYIKQQRQEIDSSSLQSLEGRTDTRLLTLFRL